MSLTKQNIDAMNELLKRRPLTASIRNGQSKHIKGNLTNKNTAILWLESIKLTAKSKNRKGQEKINYNAIVAQANKMLGKLRNATPATAAANRNVNETLDNAAAANSSHGGPAAAAANKGAFSRRKNNRNTGANYNNVSTAANSSHGGPARKTNTKPLKVVFFDLDETLVFKCGSHKGLGKYVYLGEYSRSNTNETDTVGIYTTKAIIKMLKTINKNKNCMWFIVSHGSNIQFLDFFETQGVNKPNGMRFLEKKIPKSTQVINILNGLTNPVYSNIKAVFVGDSHGNGGANKEAANGAGIPLIKVTNGTVQCDMGGFTFPSTVMTDENVEEVMNFINT